MNDPTPKVEPWGEVNNTMEDASKILSDRLKGSNSTGRQAMDKGKTIEKGHECSRKEQWGQITEKVEDHGRRLNAVEEMQKKQGDDISTLDRRTYETYNEIMTNISDLKTDVMDQISGLRKDLGLTEQHNGVQDDQIKGIHQKEKEKIEAKARNRWIVIGTILAVTGSVLGTLLIEALKYYTTFL